MKGETIQKLLLCQAVKHGCLLFLIYFDKGS